MIHNTLTYRTTKIFFAIAFSVCLSGMADQARGQTAASATVRISITGKSNISTAEIGKSFDSQCSEVVVALDVEKADYLLEAIDRGTGRGAGRGRSTARYEVTLFNRGGDRVFSSETVYLGNAFKDVCSFIRKQRS
jgi:hypothetical protein